MSSFTSILIVNLTFWPQTHMASRSMFTFQHKRHDSTRHTTHCPSQCHGHCTTITWLTIALITFCHYLLFTLSNLLWNQTEKFRRKPKQLSFSLSLSLSLSFFLSVSLSAAALTNRNTPYTRERATIVFWANAARESLLWDTKTCSALLIGKLLTLQPSLSLSRGQRMQESFMRRLCPKRERERERAMQARGAISEWMGQKMAEGVNISRIERVAQVGCLGCTIGRCNQLNGVLRLLNAICSGLWALNHTRAASLMPRGWFHKFHFCLQKSSSNKLFNTKLWKSIFVLKAINISISFKFLSRQFIFESWHEMSVNKMINWGGVSSEESFARV